MADVVGAKLNDGTLAGEWLARASSDPVGVLVEAEAGLVGITDPDARSVALRALSIANRNAGTLDESVRYAQSASEVPNDPTLRLEALGTMAGSMAMAGDVVGALEVLEATAKEAKGLIAAQLEFQKGFVLTMRGDFDRALTCYSRALPIFREAGRSDLLAQVLHNEGFIYTHTGRLSEAENVLLEARRLEEENERILEMAGTDHNLGLLASYRGDIPEALRRLTLSDETYMLQSGDDVPRHVSRCEILLSAGLFTEAFQLATRIAKGAKAKGRAEDEADALLVAARAALLAGDAEQSMNLSRRAVDRFERQEREVWATQAKLALVEATYESKGPSEALRNLARRVAADLETSRFGIAATRARLLAGRISVDLDDLPAATEDLTAIADRRTGPAELRVQHWQATAMLRMARGDLRGADSAARAGLDLLDEYQAGLGATDLRFGIERQGVELGALGLRLAAESGSPRRLLRWMERTRARALRYQPVVPDEDDPEREVLAELRRVSAERRDPQNRDDPDLVQKERRLQEELRRSSRMRRSNYVGRADFTLDELVAALGDRILLELGSVDGRLVAIRATGGRFTKHEIGDAATIGMQLARLRFDMRRVARMRRDPLAVREAVKHLDQMVLGGLRVDRDEVVLVPSGPLMAAPWAAFPSLAGRTLSVAPSAEIWWRAEGSECSGKGTVIVAGPDLENASREVAALKELYPTATVFQADDSTQHFGSAIRGAGTAHAACHASFEVDNPMFSSLRLSDGDFNIYDLERLDQPPDLMVLSACDSGYTDTRAGDELTGLTSALLSMGSKAVVASVGLVPDSTATSDLMVRFHQGLNSGLSPARALSTAQTESLDTPDGYIAAASFLCIGG